MNRVLFVTGLILCSFTTFFAQPKKTVKRDTIPAPIQKIVFDHAFRIDTLPADTDMYRLHVLNPASNISPWFSYLTRTAYPVEWLQFNKRNKNQDPFYPFWYMEPYATFGNNNFFYKTKRQFSNLSYKTAGDDNNNEEQLFVLHTQNITKKSNLGLLFNMNSSLLKFGNEEKYENGSDDALDLFYRYSGENYRGFYRFYLNTMKQTETGGLLKDSSLDYNGEEVYALDIRLNGPRSKYKKMGFLMTQELDFKKNFEVVNRDTAIKDSLIRKKRVYGSFLYVLNIETNKRNHVERQQEKLVYKNFYNSNGISNDSITLDKLSNKFSLRSPFIVKYLPNLDVSFTTDLYKARFGNDSIFVGSNQYYLIKQNSGSFLQTYISGNAKQSFGYVDWDFSLDSYLMGYGVGDYQLSATANFYANKAKTLGLQLNALSSLKTPSFMLVRNFSNHFNYNYFNTFDREKRQELNGTFRIGGKALEITGSYLLLDNFLYFDSLALPKQAPLINSLSTELSSELHLRKFFTINKAEWQESDGDKYIHVPRWMLFHSMNFQHTFFFKATGGRLFMQLGYDLTYTSAFKAAAYMPATGVFYLQDKKEIGNYAKVDVHLSMKVKTVSFFVKLSHVNSRYATRQFTSLHYPMMPMVFSYGINWLFYD